MLCVFNLGARFFSDGHMCAHACAYMDAFEYTAVYVHVEYFFSSGAVYLVGTEFLSGWELVKEARLAR